MLKLERLMLVRREESYFKKVFYLKYSNIYFKESFENKARDLLKKYERIEGIPGYNTTLKKSEVYLFFYFTQICFLILL